MRRIILTLILLHLCLSDRIVEQQSAPSDVSDRSEIDSRDSGAPSTPVTMNARFCSKHCAAGTSTCTKLGNVVSCCGDGIVQSSEECDWNTFGIYCNKNCKVDKTKTCGNNVIDAGEVCQGLGCNNCYVPAKYFTCSDPLNCLLSCTSNGATKMNMNQAILPGFAQLTVDVFDSAMAVVEYNNPQLTGQNLGYPTADKVTVDYLNFFDQISRYGGYSGGQYTVTMKYPVSSTLASMNKFINFQVPAYNKAKGLCFKLVLIPG